MTVMPGMLLLMLPIMLLMLVTLLMLTILLMMLLMMTMTIPLVMLLLMIAHDVMMAYVVTWHALSDLSRLTRPAVCIVGGRERVKTDIESDRCAAQNGRRCAGAALATAGRRAARGVARGTRPSVDGHSA